MDGVHDCGGVEGYGPIVMEDENVPKFPEPWQRMAFGLHWGVAFQGFWNIDAIRHAMERMGAIEYLTTPYYEHWLRCNEILLVEKGVFTQEEIKNKQNEIRAAMSAGGD
jgi:nitrile hydratase